MGLVFFYAIQLGNKIINQRDIFMKSLAGETGDRCQSLMVYSVALMFIINLRLRNTILQTHHEAGCYPSRQLAGHPS